MKTVCQFQRRGIVEGFFGPPWSMAQRKALFSFGAERGMNTYLYAPKDDPYHRERWMNEYPPILWRELLQLICAARKHTIEFVYGFHPGKGLCFSANEPVRTLLEKAKSFYDAGIRTFAVLFDDIPSRLEHTADRKHFHNSLARAEGVWLEKILERQPSKWSDVEWWICPSYYTPDPLLARAFGVFENHFLESFARHLPSKVACLWTGPAVVPKKITLAHIRRVARQIKHPLILWDNYPVNDLSMSTELHIGPLTGRAPRLAEVAYGYLNNPLLQEELSFLPLATCFHYAADPKAYDPERSWRGIITERFGSDSLRHWLAIRGFCEAHQQAMKARKTSRIHIDEPKRLRSACDYIDKNRRQKWAREIRPWRGLMETALSDS
jgi:hyaluronoglucosaminidase